MRGMKFTKMKLKIVGIMKLRAFITTCIWMTALFRNLYKRGGGRRAWPNEADRAEMLHEKHIRGNEARAAATIRKLKKERERMHELPGCAQDELTNDTE